jgi:hypothetical protein
MFLHICFVSLCVCGRVSLQRRANIEVTGIYKKTAKLGQNPSFALPSFKHFWVDSYRESLNLFYDNNPCSGNVIIIGSNVI